MARIRSRDVESGAVNRRILSAGSVGRRQVGRWAVGGPGPGGAGGGLAPGAVQAPQLAPNSVQAPQLADSSVSAPKLEDFAVTEPKLADGSVTSPKVPAGALGARELANGSITLPKFQQGTRPVQLVDTLPVLPDDDFPPGAAVVNLTDGKVYRHSAPQDVWGETFTADWPESDGWTAQVDTFDLRGLIEEGQVGQGAITAGTVAANAIGATELAAIFVEVDKWIRSFNWDPGVAGWAIDGDGNAEFNDATFRGNIRASSVTSGQLKSPNYSAGSAGWAVGADGSAEFYDVTVRGSIAASTVTSGQLVSSNYSAGTAGWALDSSGNAEFNDATFRGNIKASSVTSGQLVSANYSAGSQGWALDANGNAELNDATFRGNIKASSVTSGQLVSANYSAGSDGWALDAAGNAEFNDVTIRGSTMVGGTVTGATFETTAGLKIDGGSRTIVFSNQSLIDNVGDFGLLISADPIILSGAEYVSLGDESGNTGEIRSRTIAETLTSASPSLRVATVSPYHIARESSSATTKRDIEDVDLALAYKALDFRPVWFRSDPDKTIDPAGWSFYGFIAEELDAAGFPQLVDYDGDGQPAGVAYDRIPVLMLAVMQDQQRRLEQLEAACA